LYAPAVGGVLAVELPLMACACIVAVLAVGAILVASRHSTSSSIDRQAARRTLAGVRGVVTATIPLGGFGEIRARVGERSLRLRARSDHPVALGTGVIVVQQLDESTVLVRASPPR